MSNISAEILSLAVPVVGEVPTHFDRPAYALGGLAVAGAIAAVTARKDRQLSQQAEVEAGLYPDPDMAQYTADRYNKHRITTRLAGGLLAVASGAGLVNMAEPTVTENQYQAEKVSVIVEAGLDSRAEDVVDSSSDSNVTRMAAGINSGLRFARELGDDVEVQFVFAGSPARSLGFVEGSSGSEEVVKAADDYTRDLSTASAPDIGGALGVADANEADQTILITADSDAATADAIAGYTGELTVVAPGEQDSKFKFLGTEHVADYTPTFGEIEAEQVQTTDEIQEIMDEITSTKIVSTKVMPSKVFEKIRNFSGLALGFGAGIMSLRPLKRRRN